MDDRSGLAPDSGDREDVTQDPEGAAEQAKKVGCTILTGLLMVTLATILIVFLISLVTLVNNLIR